jgi:N-methylhydantoinase A
VPPRLDNEKAAARAPERTKVFHGDGWIDCARYDAEVEAVVGPAVIEGYTATTWVPPGWTATLDAADNLVLRRSS